MIFVVTGIAFVGGLIVGLIIGNRPLPPPARRLPEYDYRADDITPVETPSGKQKLH